MDREQNQLLIFSEELVELATEILHLSNHVSKAIRFGIDELKDVPKSNRERINAEWNDLLGSLQKLRSVGVTLVPDLKEIEKKMSKIDEYTIYSRSLGKVEG